MPPAFPPEVASALMQAEGASYYWLFKHIMRLFAWAPCGAVGQKAPWVPPEGWAHLYTLGVAGASEATAAATDATDATAAGGELSGGAATSADGSQSPGIEQQKKWPFAAVLRRASSPAVQASCKAFLQSHPSAQHTSRRDMRRSETLCAGDELVVLVRGTSAPSEWDYNLDYGLSKNAAYGQGLQHNGFRKLADSLWGGKGGLKSVLDQYAGSVSSVTIAGHSLGAASAALLAARAQVRG
jgi:hypothetical protein